MICRKCENLSHSDLSVDQVVALLAQWNLDKELATESVCIIYFVPFLPIYVPFACVSNRIFKEISILIFFFQSRHHRFRAQNIDGGCLAEIEEGDFNLSDFKKAKRFHLRKFWKCLDKAKAGNVVLQTTTAMAAAPPLPTAAAAPISCVVSSRFIGHYDERDSSKGHKIIGPIYGLKAQEVTNLYRAFAKIKATYAADKVPYPPEFDMLRVNIYVAKQFVDTNWNKIRLKYPRITKAQAAAINFYTQETPFYPYLNRKLREKNRHAVTRLFPFLKLLLSALYCLPLAGGNGSINVKRGVKLKLAPQFPTASKTVWWSINSTTQNISVLQSSKFLGSVGPRTIFDITARSLVSVKHFSALDEDELILLPGTQLEVMGVLEQGELDIVQLQEPVPVVPMLDFAHPSLLAGYSVSGIFVVFCVWFC